MKAIGMKAIVGTLVLLASTQANSALEYASPSKITRVITFNAYGGGDIVFQIQYPASNCAGYWIAKSDPGFDGSLSTLLAAYHASTTVKVVGHDDQKWPGSGSFYCKLYSIELVP